MSSAPILALAAARQRFGPVISPKNMSPSMAIIAADWKRVPGLSQIRRLEAAAFRAWPSASTYYDGTWSIRLTPDHPSRRLNSVNPLDPNDHGELGDRIARAEARFLSVGKPLTFRQTPLASRELEQYLHDEGFAREHESCVHVDAADGVQSRSGAQPDTAEGCAALCGWQAPKCMASPRRQRMRWFP